ncbi:MAG TPA: PilZ domain-containing protein [Pyrinomonadaceae bacterium]|nr:PilZ domain-containing protein [Pyrinomonadaceae bacterium]
MEEHTVADDVEETFESQEERRAHDRSRLILDVFFDGHDMTGVASTKDISPGGLYMNTQANIPEGAFLLVRIPFREGVEVVCTAEVVYSNPGTGVGLRFHDLPDEVRAVLEQEVQS